jgi:hypothetical protein
MILDSTARNVLSYHDASMTVTCKCSKRTTFIPGKTTYTAEDWALPPAQFRYDGNAEYPFKQLDNLGYWWRFGADSGHNLDALLLVNMDCFKYFKRYPDVLLVDQRL